MYRRIIKRFIDILVSILILLVLGPFLILCIIYLALFNDGAGIFFTQPRPGRNAKIFHVIKFKTMNDKRDAAGNLLPDKERITVLGNFMRTYSLDEIPQLINVLKGDMSLVGPRPLLVRYLPLYSQEQARRHEVRPGITGWAQTNGRNSISWAQKFKLDVWYVDNCSFWLDMKILSLTVKKVVKGSDINASARSTMPGFNGDN